VDGALSSVSVTLAPLLLRSATEVAAFSIVAAMARMDAPLRCPR
jgi:hypothetical protein